LRPFELDRLIPLTEGLSPTQLWLLTGGYLARYLARTLGNTRLYKLNPLECRRPGVMTPNPDLDRYGNNLPGLVAYMQRNHHKAWAATLQAMRDIVPGLEDIRIAFTQDRRLALQFVEKGVGRPWTSEEVSDGTIQSLALFAVLHDPRISLVLIEEPENSVHPWIVRAFVDACRAAKDKQIIITSHSPALIGYLKPDEVTVVWRTQGRTKLQRLVDIEPEAYTMWSSGELTPFDILDSGWIRQSVPEGYT
jgi:predicted ATPase